MLLHKLSDEFSLYLQDSLCRSYVERAVSLLKKQNSLLSSHPNSHIYSQLRSLVDFDGFYLESEPCLVCNDPEIQSSVSIHDLLVDY